MARRTGTREDILERATDLFGSRGVEAVSLDQIASGVGVAKQTLLYWFPSKDDLVHQVLLAAAAELTVVIEAAIRATGDDPLDRIESVVKAVFRPAVRRPALLGLVREIGRLPAPVAGELTRQLQPLAARAVSWMQREMDAGRLRRGDPKVVVALAYATVTGIATEPEALGVSGWTADTGGLRRLRRELVSFLRGALAP